MSTNRGMNIPTKAHPRWTRWAAGGLASLILLLHLWSLPRYPAPSTDEAWLTSRAWAFQETGRAYGPLDAGIADRLFAQYWLTNEWLIAAIQSLVLRLTVKPGLLALRALSLAWGGVLLAASGWSATRLFGKSVGCLSVLLLSLSPAFFYSAHQVRFDIMASALAYASVACVLAGFPTSLSDSKTAIAFPPATRWRFCASMLGGVLLTLAIETHLNCLIFIPAIGLLFLIEYGQRFWRQPDFRGFVSGTLLGACWYTIIHILPSPTTFVNLYRLLYGPTHQPPVSNGLAKVLEGIVGTSNLLLVAGSSLVLAAILSVPGLYRLKSKPAIHALVFNAALLTAAALIIPNKVGHYAILLAPGLLWLAASYLVREYQTAWRGQTLDFLRRGLLWGLLASFILTSAAPLARDGSQEYKIAQSLVDHYVRTGDSVIGPQVYWLGLHDHTYYSWELLFLYQRIHPNATLEEAFAAYRPDVFIIDQSLETLISDSIDPASRWYQYHLPRAELLDYLDAHARLEASFPTAGYGAIQIYRIIWGSS